MYEMLTGRTPFDGDSPVAVAIQHIQDAPIPPSQFNPNIPTILEEVILRCLEKVSKARFRDGSELARAIEAVGEAILSDTVTGTEGCAPIPTTSHSIPSTPGNSGYGATREHVTPLTPASFPAYAPGPGVPSDQFQHGTKPHSRIAQPNQPISHFSSISMVLILLLEKMHVIKSVTNVS
jgi:serine/threonine-protein kinase